MRKNIKGSLTIKQVKKDNLILQFLTIFSVFLKWIGISFKNDIKTRSNKNEKMWDMISDDYDEKTKRFEELRIKSIKYAEKYLKDNDTVLDYGCATGNISLEIADKVNKIHGIDISSKMIKQARIKLLNKKIDNILFSQAEIFSEKLKEESFDVIIAFNIIHLIKDSNSVLKRIHALLKPKGIIISVTPCLGEKKSLINILLSILRITGISIKLFKITDLKNIFAKENFQIIKIIKMNTSEKHYFISAKKINNNKVLL